MPEFQVRPPPSLPTGWASYTDPSSGQIYYAHLVTGHSQWDPPITPSTSHIPPPPQQIQMAFHAPSNLNSTSLEPTISETPQSSLLITTRTAMNESMASDSHKNKHEPLDYPEISAGTIADLAYLQSDWKYSQYGTRCYYEPISPFEMPLELQERQVEVGRAEIRYTNLKNELQKITSKYSNS